MANTFLSRSNSSGTSTQKGTISVWIKGSEEPSGNNQTTLACWGNANNHGALIWNGGDKIDAFDYQSGYASQLQTNALLRDSSAWYHIVYAWDTTLSTANDRQKIYINGIEQTYSTRTNYSTNAATSWNANSYSMRVGGLNSSSYFNGLMSHIHFIDGIAYAPTLFGETDSTTGQWKIKTSPSVTYGNNGFFVLKDGITITDSSPNSNNFSLSGGTLTKTEDCPSNNFATLNPLLDVNAVPTFSNGNTTIVGSSSGGARLSGSSISVGTGKWYYEIKTTVDGSQPYIGVIDAQSNIRRNSSYFVAATSGSNDSGYAVNMSGDIYYNNSSTYASNIGSISTGDILGFAVDLTSTQKTCTIYKNGTSMRTFNLANSSSGNYMLGVCSISNSTSAKCEVNFGNGKFGTTSVSSVGTNASANGIFEYAVPSGYTALSTKGLNL